jgi:hypothetical protein
MGTTAKDGEAPAPPETLLPRPRVLGPANGAAVNHSNPLFRWDPVVGSLSYRVEVCGDSACDRLLVQAETEETMWRPDVGLPQGDLHWRVRAVAASGLDGYPSSATLLRQESAPDALDLAAPAVVVAVDLEGSVESGQSVVLGPRGRLRWFAHDDCSGVAAVFMSLDDGAWVEVAGEFLVLPERDAAGGISPTIQVSLRAVDRAGRESAPSAFTVVWADRSGEAPRVLGEIP